MKTAIFLSVGMLSSIAFAIPQIEGRYACKTKDGSKSGVLTFSVVNNAIQIKAEGLSVDPKPIECRNSSTSGALGELIVMTKADCDDHRIAVESLVTATALHVYTEFRIQKTSETSLTYSARLTGSSESGPVKTELTLNCERN